MNHYGSFSDDFYVNLNLNTEMDLPTQRETVLHFFEQLQKHHPSMKNFYSREAGEYTLESDKDEGGYRWATVERRRVLSGQVNPDSVEEALNQHGLVLDLLPYTLAVSSLDCESLNLSFGFDFTYRGNHNALVAEALGLPPAYEKVGELAGSTLINYEPTLQFTCDEDCRLQGRLSVETRTSAYHIRTGEFTEEQLSVYLTARHYGSLTAGESFVTALEQLAEFMQELMDGHVVEHVLRPLQQAIAIK